MSAFPAENLSSSTAADTGRIPYPNVENSSATTITQVLDTKTELIDAAIEITKQLARLYAITDASERVRKITKYVLFDSQKSADDIEHTNAKGLDAIEHVGIHNKQFSIQSYLYKQREHVSRVTSADMLGFICKIRSDPQSFDKVGLESIVVGREHIWGIFLRNPDHSFSLQALSVKDDILSKVSAKTPQSRFQWEPENKTMKIITPIDDQQVEEESEDVPLPSDLQTVVTHLKDMITRQLKDSDLAKLIVKYILIVFVGGRKFIQNYHQKKILDAYLTDKNFYYVENRLFTKIVHLVPSDADELQRLLLMTSGQLATLQVESQDQLREDVKLLRLTTLTLKDGFIRKIRSKYYENERDTLDLLTEGVLQTLGLSGFVNISSRLKASFNSWWKSFKDDPETNIDEIFKSDESSAETRAAFKAEWKVLSETKMPPQGAITTYMQTIIRYFEDAFADFHAGVDTRGDISRNDDWNSKLLKILPILLRLSSTGIEFQHQQNLKSLTEKYGKFISDKSQSSANSQKGPASTLKPSTSSETPELIIYNLMALTQALGKFIVGKSHSSKIAVNQLIEGLDILVQALNS